MSKFPEQAKKADALRALHGGPDILVLPNAWDCAGARLFVQAGFPAVATTSSGIAFTYGLPDGEQIRRDAMLAVVGRIAAAIQVPVSADLEAGYGPSPEDVGETIARAIRVGAVGCNLEDSRRDAARPLRETQDAAARVTAARAAATQAGVPIVINARTDGYLRRGSSGADPFADTVARAHAYLEAGADCIFIPGVQDAETIGKLVREIEAPINILAGQGSPPVGELQDLGVARVSVGGSLMRATLGLVRRAAEELKTRGTYGYTCGAIAHADLQRLFST